jgi:hypothetical protein
VAALLSVSATGIEAAIEGAIDGAIDGVSLCPWLLDELLLRPSSWWIVGMIDIVFYNELLVDRK